MRRLHDTGNDIKLGELMTEQRNGVATQPAALREEATDRRGALKKLGRFAAITAPAVTLMLAAGTKPSAAIPCSLCPSSRAFKTSEGAVDVAALLAGVSAMQVNGKACVAVHPLDAAGICIGAIQALSARVASLEAAIA